MQSEPEIVQRAEQPYVAIKASVTMETIGTVLQSLHPEMFAWLDAHGVRPAGAPFSKYNVIDMQRETEIEVGVPVAEAVVGDQRVSPGVLPAGSYARTIYTGHPSGLADATAVLLDWAAKRGLAWDASDTPKGQRWGCRLEVYDTDPREEPDLDKWETHLVFRLAA
jgi:effector-binding domain-containing protein